MSPLPATFTRAQLLIEGGTRIPCWFNPTTMDRTRRADWDFRRAAGEAAPRATYRGGHDESLTLNLLLHADERRRGPQVRDAIKQLIRLVDPTVTIRGPSPRKRPPTVQFRWGRYESILTVCESVTVTIELFDIDGTPLRAQVVLQLRQFQPEPGQAEAGGQNPTSRTTERAISHRVSYGDSLASIAFEHYGDPARWREVAEHNDIEDPLKLPVGSVVLVPVGER